MGLTVYWGSGSAVSWRVLIALELKGLKYKSHRLALSEKEQRSEAFLALSPRGTFPVLCDGHLIVRDSLAILAYLDEAYPEPSLFGQTAEQVGLVWRHIGEQSDHFGRAAGIVTRAIFRKNSPTTVAEVGVAATEIDHELDLLERVLDKQAWIAGEHVSTADICYYPTLQRLLRAAQKGKAAEMAFSFSLNEQHPAVHAWLLRFSRLPGIDATYPPHWRGL